MDSNSSPITHENWTALLQDHVSDKGKVNYKSFISDSVSLNSYLKKLQENHPNEKSWSKNEQLAYWINAYNAFTVKLICDNYPVKSIKDITSGPNIPFVNSPWDIKFINIEEETYDLNDIEHGIIRGNFEDARIHFAVNCASGSCPRLINEAFEATSLDQQLDEATHSFLKDEGKNIVRANELQVSKLFSWYSGDFKKEHETVIAFIDAYTDLNISSDASVSYLDYDWTLNE